MKIELHNIHKNIGKNSILKSIDFCVETGEVLGVLGPNGAGKTTLLRLLSGFLHSSSGYIALDDKPIKEYPPGFLGYLPEGTPLYPDLSIKQHLKFILNAHNIKDYNSKEYIKDIIDLLNLHTEINTPAKYLSKGFKRRLGLAMTLVHDPQIIILDEPTDGFDLVQKQNLHEIFTAISPNKIIIFSTHDLDEAECLCSKVILLDNGKILEQGCPKELVSQHSQSEPIIRLSHPYAWGISVRHVLIELGINHIYFTNYTLIMGNYTAKYLHNLLSERIPLASELSVELFSPHQFSLHDIFLQKVSQT